MDYVFINFDKNISFMRYIETINTVVNSTSS